MLKLAILCLGVNVFALNWNRSLLAAPDEFPDHGLDAGEGLPADGLDPAGGQEEAEAAGVGQLDGVGVGDTQFPFCPVVAAAWEKRWS